jgi:hypothetical protein
MSVCSKHALMHLLLLPVYLLLVPCDYELCHKVMLLHETACRVDVGVQQTQAICICPTREAVIYSLGVCKKLAARTNPPHCLSCNIRARRAHSLAAVAAHHRARRHWHAGLARRLDHAAADCARRAARARV